MRTLRLFPGLLLACFVFPLLASEVIPNRYLIELDELPVADQIVRNNEAGMVRRLAVNGMSGNLFRQRLAAQQRQVRRELEGREVVVLGTLDTLQNALIVQMPDGARDTVRQLAGVRRVHPVRKVERHLDRAVVMHQVVDFWALTGQENAGAGIKVGVIDSGMDAGHPALEDSSLVIPDGYPRYGEDSSDAYTNHKIIVARSYVRMLGRDSDYTPADRVGHGTFVGTIVAGARVNGPLGSISGLAPRAYLGNYKVFGSPAEHDYTTDDVVLAALEDAIKDGMDVVNLSLGAPAPGLPSDDIEVAAIERAVALGVVVVVSAGNSGPDATSLASPGTAPSAITVGASLSDRAFRSGAQIGEQNFTVVPGDNSVGGDPVSGPLADVAALDGSGLACSSLPSGSLQGKVALIARGVCLFSEKLDHASAAGATAALVYTDDRPVSTMATSGVALPAGMISNADGTAIKQLLRQTADTPAVALHFRPGAVGVDPRSLAAFSGAGPSLDLSVKPDLVALGTSIYSATQRLDPRGEMYDSSAYTVASGTSFSAPMVSAAVALLKSARPGLTALQYRSLVINNATPFALADGTLTGIQFSGAGQLNVLAAYQARVTATPATLSFGSGAPAPVQILTITNISGDSDTISVSIDARDGRSGPVASTSVLQLEPGSSQDIRLAFGGTGLASGAYEGFIRLTSSRTGAESRVPYWYAQAGTSAQRVSILDQGSLPKDGVTYRDALLFRLTDNSGVPISATPTVEVVSGDGQVIRVRRIEQQSPFAFSLDYRTGSAAEQRIEIRAGDAKRTIRLR